MKQQVQDLQREVHGLRSLTGDDWLTEQRAAEIRSLVQDVLADADTRASLQGSGITAGWDKGFFIGSADGNFKLNIGGQLQVRYVYNHQDESPSDDDRSGFEMRRTRLLLNGHVFDQTWTYDIQLAVNRSTGDMQLEDAGWLQKSLGDGWHIRAGQMKAPFLREETLSSKRMLAVERSLINSQFTAGTVQGVQVGWEHTGFRAYAMYHDGDGTANTAWSVEDTEFAVSARGEWLALGEWKYFSDYSSFRGEDGGLLIGAAVNYSKDEYGTSFMPGPPATGNDSEVENLGLTVDATWDLGGGSIAGAFVYRNLQSDGAGSFDLDQIGLLLRGGIFVTDDWEIYGQYEWGDVDISGVEDLSVATIGATRYWDGHNLKWQTDVGFAFDEVASTWASDGAGWRADSPDEDGQIVLRSQIQLLF